MELQYKKEMEKHGISFSELPEDAQTGIDQINDVLRAFNMLKKKGKNPTPKALKKLKAMDKWVTYEIYDFLHDTDKNEDEIPFDAEDVTDELNDTKEQEADPLGLKIEAELDALYASGQRSFTIDELDDEARETYNVLFDAYDDGEENGITTSKYSLIEGRDKKFTLKLK